MARARPRSVKVTQLTKTSQGDKVHQHSLVIAKKSWRTRTKVKSRLLMTIAEKKSQRDYRDDRKKAIDTTFDNIDAYITEQSEALSTRFPNTTAKYFRQLFYQMSRMQASKRKVNPWNAFVRKMKTQNNGKSRTCSGPPVTDLTCYPPQSFHPTNDNLYKK